MENNQVHTQNWGTLQGHVGVNYGIVNQHYLFHSQPQDAALDSRMNSAEPLALAPSVSSSVFFRKISSVPPLTDSHVIQQRSRVVKELHAKLIDAECNGVILTGIAGQGKSTLAALIYRYVQEQQTKSFAAPPLWLHIDPSTTFLDILGTLYTLFGVPIPELANRSLANQAYELFNLLSTPTSSRLIILDEFENVLDWQTGKVRLDRPGITEWLNAVNSQPLGRGCRLLLTSRLYSLGASPLSSPFFQQRKVLGLSKEEGIELFQKRGIHVTDAELGLAILFCKGHAFSLTLLLALLEEYKLSLASLLENPALWTDDATALFDKLWEQMQELQRTVLRGFSIYSISVPLEAVTAVVDLPQLQIVKGLRPLLGHHLIQSIEEEQYQLHPIVRQYVVQHFVENDENANREAVRGAHTRAASYCVHVVTKDLNKGILNITFCMEALQHYIQANQWNEAYTMLNEYRLFSILEAYGAYTHLFSICQQLLTANIWEPQPTQKAELLFHLGHIYEVFGHITPVIECYEQSRLIYHEEGRLDDEVRLFVSISNFYCQHGDPQQGLHFGQKALNLCQAEEMQGLKAAIFAQLGLVSRHLGDMDQALKYYHQALSLEKENPAFCATVFNGIGEVYRNLGSVDRAIEYYGRCITELIKDENRSIEATVLGNLGIAYQELGNSLEALALYQQALSIHRAMGFRLGEVTALHNEACIYLEQGHYQQAVQLLQQTLPIREEIGDYEGKGFSLYSVSNAYFMQGNYKEALKYAWEALYVHRNIGNRFHEVDILETLGFIYWILRNHKKSIDCFQQALLLSREVKDDRNEISILAKISQVFQSEKKYLFALAALSLAIRLINEKGYRDIFEIQREFSKMIVVFGDMTKFVHGQITVHAPQILDYALTHYQEQPNTQQIWNVSTPIITIQVNSKGPQLLVQEYKASQGSSIKKLLYNKSSM